MDLSIRQAVLSNLSSEGVDGIRYTIQDAVKSADEKTLPGLGVMFELVWNDADEVTRNSMVSSITSQING